MIPHKILHCLGDKNPLEISNSLKFSENQTVKDFGPPTVPQKHSAEVLYEAGWTLHRTAMF